MTNISSYCINFILPSSFLSKTLEVFTYDLDKNLQKDGRWEYSWNSLNQLEKMSLIPTATGTGKARHQVWTFVYDAQGRGVAKRFYEKFGPNFNAGSFPADYHKLEETLFFYDGWNLIAEVNSFTGDMKTYLWGLDLSGSFQGAGGVGGLLAIKDWKTNKTYAVLNDGRGNVTGLVDASSGEQVAKYAYGPFGESVMATGEAREVCPFRFSTKYFDKATGLHYYGYRYYSASMGRWLNRDPIGEEGGVNVYGFVGNDPVNKWDYLGMWTADGVRKILCCLSEGRLLIEALNSGEMKVSMFDDFLMEDVEVDSTGIRTGNKSEPYLALSRNAYIRGTVWNGSLWVNRSLSNEEAVRVIRDEYGHTQMPTLNRSNFTEYIKGHLEQEVTNSFNSEVFAFTYNNMYPNNTQLPLTQKYLNKNGVPDRNLIFQDKYKNPYYNPSKTPSGYFYIADGISPINPLQINNWELCDQYK